MSYVRTWEVDRALAGEMRQRVIYQNFKTMRENQRWLREKVDEIKHHRWRIFHNGWLLVLVTMRLHEQQRLIELTEELVHGAEPRWEPVSDPRIPYGMPPGLDT